MGDGLQTFPGHVVNNPEQQSMGASGLRNNPLHKGLISAFM